MKGFGIVCGGGAQWTENGKNSAINNISPGQKKPSWNQINQFYENLFWPNSIFCNFNNGQKSIFELWKSLKLSKM